MSRIHLFFLSVFFLLTSPSFSQELGCATSASPSSPPTISARQTCNEYSGSNDFFMPNENSNPVTLKVNFIFITDTDPNERKNFESDNAAHNEFLDIVARRVESRIKQFNATCPSSQIRQCSGSKKGCCKTKAIDAGTCLCQDCVDLGPNWIKDSKIRFDVTKHWVADPFLWDNDPDRDTDASNCAPEAKGSDLYTQTCPTTNDWYLHDFDLNIPFDCTVQPPVPQGVNVYFTVDGDAYQSFVVNQDPNANWCGLACASTPSETDYNHFAREHMPNIFLKYYQFRNNANALNDIAWETARSIVHEIGHTLSLRHNDACSCYLMKTQSCGTKNMITKSELMSMHRTIALSNVRRLVKCKRLARYNDNNPEQDALRVDTSQIWDFDMKVFKHIVVEPGATLTLSCRLYMPQGGQIIVKGGAELVVDGGLISYETNPAHRCPESAEEACNDLLWRGIEVWEDASVSPINETSGYLTGLVRLKNDGRIENAAQPISLNTAALLSNSSNISIYPNPTYSDITITKPQDLLVKQIEVVDAFGRIVLQKKSNLSVMTTFRLPPIPGIYYVYIITDHQTITQKIIRL